MRSRRKSHTTHQNSEGASILIPGVAAKAGICRRGSNVKSEGKQRNPVQSRYEERRISKPD